MEVRREVEWTFEPFVLFWLSAYEKPRKVRGYTKTETGRVKKGKAERGRVGEGMRDGERERKSERRKRELDGEK